MSTLEEGYCVHTFRGEAHLIEDLANSVEDFVKPIYYSHWTKVTWLTHPIPGGNRITAIVESAPQAGVSLAETFS